MSMTDQSPTFVSICICTRNRPDMIRQAVESVLANDYPFFELTVVDQSTTSATEGVLRPIAASDRRLSYVHDRAPGVSRGTNKAIRCSQGEIIAFTDDDCVVPTDWLTTIKDIFAADPTADMLYGQVVAPPDREWGVTPVLQFREMQRLSRRDGLHIIGMGANFAARRRMFDAIGLFDEELGPGTPLSSGQDFDLMYRAYVAGYITLLCPSVEVVHYGTRTREEWPKRMREYGIGDGAFFLKHVRCGDFFALWLLTQQVGNQATRQLAKRLLRRSSDFTYVRANFSGMWESLLLAVDHRNRLYKRAK